MTDHVNSPPLDLRVLSGNPAPEELAAVMAVVTHALEELADDDALRESRAVSAWDRRKRPIRQPLYPQAGAWRGFSG